VRPENGDDLGHLDTEPDPERGGLRLRKRPDGGCIHLGPDGCTVYENRPAACRGFDCRAFAVVDILPRWETPDGDIKAPPVWVFDDVRSQSDRIHLETLKLAAREYIRANPNWSVDGAMQAAARNHLAHRAAAARLVTGLDELPRVEEHRRRRVGLGAD
jgi:hypothetical protein